jgi:Lipocalin-like domain
MKSIRILAATFVLGLVTSVAAAQPAKTLRDQLVGTWSFVIAEITTADGKKTLPFGDKPKGMLIFTADGHFSQVHVAGDLPKIASNNRLAGTDADNKAIVHGSLSLFGTYAVDEDKKTVTFKIEASTFPNLAGVAQTRTIDLLTADEFRNTNPAASRDVPAVATNIYKRMK